MTFWYKGKLVDGKKTKKSYKTIITTEGEALLYWNYTVCWGNTEELTEPMISVPDWVAEKSLNLKPEPRKLIVECREINRMTHKYYLPDRYEVELALWTKGGWEEVQSFAGGKKFKVGALKVHEEMDR